MNALALLLLLTVGTAEQTYGPYARPVSGGEQSVAAAHGHVLLAWSENDAAGRARVHVVLLDSSGRAISPVSVLPALTPNRDAILPAIATDGTSFLVVWEELLGVQQTVGLAVDASGLPSGLPHPLGDLAFGSAGAGPAPRVSWSGDAYVVLPARRNSAPVRVNREGEVLEPVTGTPQAIAKDGTFGWAEVTQMPTTYGFGPFLSFGPPYTYQVRSHFGTRTVIDTMPQSVPVSTPWIAPAGDGFVVTWTTKGVVHYRLTNEVRHEVLADVDESSRPRVSCAETRCVIAWPTRFGDVHALAFDPTHPGLPAETFIVAASERDEREAEVAMITNDRALITWRSTGNGELLAGRIVSFGTKRRAVH